MDILSALREFFETASWRREQADILAHERFNTFDYRSTVAVLHCLVETLGIRYKQLHPHTELINDLAADEDEPEWISSWIQEELGISLSPQQVAEVHTVGGLINLVAGSPK